MKRWIHASENMRSERSLFSREGYTFREGVSNAVSSRLGQDSRISYDSELQEITPIIYDAVYTKGQQAVTDQFPYDEFVQCYMNNDVNGAVDLVYNYMISCIDEGLIMLPDGQKEFIEQYRSYYDAIKRVVEKVASRYDSDMTCDLNTIIKDKYKLKVQCDDILKYQTIWFTAPMVTISFALGMKATSGIRYGYFPDYILEGEELTGPSGVYYNGNHPELELKHFDSDLARLEQALIDYFENLKLIKQGECTYFDCPHRMHEDTYPEREQERAQKAAEQKASQPKWNSILTELEEEGENGVNSLYEMTEAGEYILGLCQEVESKLNLYVEPSVQAGTGGVWIYDESNNNETLVSGYDYQTFNDKTLDIAISSKNKTEFKKKYKAYLESLIE